MEFFFNNFWLTNFVNVWQFFNFFFCQYEPYHIPIYASVCGWMGEERAHPFVVTSLVNVKIKIPKFELTHFFLATKIFCETIFLVFDLTWVFFFFFDRGFFLYPWWTGWMDGRTVTVTQHPPAHHPLDACSLLTCGWTSTGVNIWFHLGNQLCRKIGLIHR
jgi:hypothetical protein